jgi:hypothetical protein
VDGYGIPKDVVDDCTLSVALDLWQAKDARNGIVGITDGVEPFRIPTDVAHRLAEAQGGGLARRIGHRMSRVDELTEQLTERITEAGHGLILQVTTDPSLVKPSPGKVSLVIMPPDIAWDGWELEPNVTFKILAVAGTANTNKRGYDLILEAMDIMHQADVNMATATPVGFDLAGAGTLAAYEITLNPM